MEAAGASTGKTLAAAGEGGDSSRIAGRGRVRPARTRLSSPGGSGLVKSAWL